MIIRENKLEIKILVDKVSKKKSILGENETSC